MPKKIAASKKGKKRILVFARNVDQILKIDPFLSESEENSLLSNLEESIDVKSIALDTFGSGVRVDEDIVKFNADKVVFFNQGISPREEEVCKNIKAMVGDIETVCFNSKDAFDSFLNTQVISG